MPMYIQLNKAATKRVTCQTVSSLWRRTPPPPEQTPGDRVKNSREDSLSQNTRKKYTTT